MWYATARPRQIAVMLAQFEGEVSVGYGNSDAAAVVVGPRGQPDRSPRELFEGSRSRFAGRVHPIPSGSLGRDSEAVHHGVASDLWSNFC